MAITRAQQIRQMYKKGSKKPVVQGGVDNYLGDQPEVQAPRKWQSSPDKPATELAYITKAEKDLIIKENIHGGLEDGPNMGPSGIISLDSFGDLGGAGAGGADTDAGGGYDTGAGGGGFSGQGGGETKSEFNDRKARETKRLNELKAQQEQKAKEMQKEARETRKKMEAKKKADADKRKARIDAILNKQAKYKVKKRDRFGKILKNQFDEYNLDVDEEGNINPFGLSNTEYKDLTSSLPSYDGPPRSPEEEREQLNNFLAKNSTMSELDNPLTQLLEKNDRFSGVNLETFQNRFNLPKSGLTSLDVALAFASPFLKKGTKKNREFFSGDADNNFKYDGLFGDRNSVLSGGKYKYNGMNIDPTTFAMLSPQEMEEVYGDYMSRRMSGEIDAAGNPTIPTGRDEGDNYVPPILPKKDDDDDDDDTTTPTRNFGGLAPRFAGSIFDFTGLADGGIARAGYMDGGRMKQIEMMEDEDDPVGGIMDLESGRQMYFLGKLVKKATRAVKKIVKSPVGKAALLYFGGGALGNLAGGSGLAGMFKGAMTPSKFLARSKLSNIFTKGGLKNIAFGKAAGAGYAMPGQGIFRPGTSGILGSGGKFSLGKALGLGLGIPTALDLMGVGKEEDDFDIDEYYKTQGIDIDAIRNNPNRILARRFMAEGGDAEPVAKKTMPLIDMDGMEKDYREDGGFVPIGRMERADDVPARLSKNEFVFTADAVRNAGEGDIDKGAEVMYNMMKNLESGGEVSEESQGLDGAREMFKTSQRLEEVL